MNPQPIISLNGRLYRVLSPGERHNREALNQEVLWIGLWPVIAIG